MTKRTHSRKLASVGGLLSTISALGCSVEAGTDETGQSLQPLTVEGGGCDGMLVWVGNDWRLSLSAGDYVEHEGERYRATQDIAYPNAECAPDAPVSWCSSWFSYEGSCDDAPANPPPAEPSCDDGEQNQGEEGVDCGGPCAACPAQETCDDGVQNQGEEGVDCGGPCAACMTSSPAPQIPGLVEAEDFVRFEDSTSGHSGDCGSGPVDQQTTTDEGGGCNIGWTAAGEWLEYDVQVDEGGTYDLVLRLASSATGSRAQVSIDGAVVGTLTGPSSGWQSWQDRTLQGVELGAGSHTVRVTFLDGSLNLNWLSFSASSGPSASCDDGIQNQGETGVDCGGPCAACPVEPTCDDGVQNQGEEGVDCGGPCSACSSGGEGVVLPARIEAEAFDRFDDATPGHSGDCGSGPVDQQTTGDAGGGCNVGWTAAGEWLEYDVQLSSSQTLDFVLRLASSAGGKRVQVSVDGNDVGTVTAPGAGWQSWGNSTIGDVSLGAGSHTIRITFLDGDVNFNWFSVDEPAAPSCDDGIQNGDEDGIDCGGSCSSCDYELISSISELKAAFAGSNGDYRMQPGYYTVDSVLSDGVTILRTAGHNNTFDFTGVTIDIPTEVLSQMRGATHTYAEWKVEGNNNVFIGGTFINTYPDGAYTVTDFKAHNDNSASGRAPGGSSAFMRIWGDGNHFINNTIEVRGSYPYGYGEIYGKGSGNVFGQKKHSGIQVVGDDTVIDGLSLTQLAFGHGIFMQGADNTTILNSYLQGEVRQGADMYNDGPDSLPDRSDYQQYYPEWRAGPIPHDRMFALTEDGIRAYATGTKLDGSTGTTGSVVIENTTVANMRSCFALVAASERAYLRNVEVIGCEDGFSLPRSGGEVIDSRGDVAYGHLIGMPYGNEGNTLYDLTLIEAPHQVGSHALAHIAGAFHDITIRSDGNSPSVLRPILMGYAWDRWDVTGDTGRHGASRSTINNLTSHPVELTQYSDRISGSSVGPVIDQGDDNNVQ